MRRRDREVTDIEEIRHILDSADYLHLGLVEDGIPYVVPMNYGYVLEDGKLTFYVHGATEGRKLDVIRKNGACCAQIDCDCVPLEGRIACQYGYSYYCLMGFGSAHIVDDLEEKIKALSCLMKAQTGKDFEFNEKLVSIVTVVRIDCDHFTAKHRPLPLVKIGFTETEEKDLDDVRRLWARGDVMNFVGFPEGLHRSEEEMKAWLNEIKENRPMTDHFSIFEDEVYCGESFYRIDPKTKKAALDIKLLPKARGRGIAAAALTLTIEKAFLHGAETVWVDPNPKNLKALALYRRVGMIQKEIPEELRDPSYEQLYFEKNKLIGS